MTLVVTDAIVLHVFDYLESSRVLRLATREIGVQSALARGVRRSSRRFGSALDLFAQGVAHLHVKPGRELHTLAEFEVTRARPALGSELDRFTGAAALAELAIRFGHGEASASLFDALADSLDRIAAADAAHATGAALAGAWRLVAELGFAPALDRCGSCNRALPPEEGVSFSSSAGSALCGDCARGRPRGRTVPAAARRALVDWLSGGEAPLPSAADARAHQRLLREFLREHLTDGRPLRAFQVWEHEHWGAA